MDSPLPLPILQFVASNAQLSPACLASSSRFLLLGMPLPMLDLLLWERLLVKRHGQHDQQRHQQVGQVEAGDHSRVVARRCREEEGGGDAWFEAV